MKHDLNPDTVDVMSNSYSGNNLYIVAVREHRQAAAHQSTSQSEWCHVYLITCGL